MMRKEVIGDATLYLGDCLKVMPTLGPVDHVIGDPPYEDELHNGFGRAKKSRGSKLKTVLDFTGINETRAEVSRQAVAASRGWVILFTLAEGVRAWRDDLQAAGAKWDTTLAWVKPDSSPRFNGQGAARGFECAVTCWCGSGYRSWNGGGRRGVFEHARSPDRCGEHPTEKPLELMQELVGLFSNAGQTILDPFMGSGTTGVACIRLGRKFVGVEMQPKYFDLACRRIEAATRQPQLFAANHVKAKQEAFDLGNKLGAVR